MKIPVNLVSSPCLCSRSLGFRLLWIHRCQRNSMGYSVISNLHVYIACRSSLKYNFVFQVYTKNITGFLFIEFTHMWQCTHVQRLEKKNNVISRLQSTAGPTLVASWSSWQRANVCVLTMCNIALTVNLLTLVQRRSTTSRGIHVWRG